MYVVPKVGDVVKWDIISQGEGVVEYEATVYSNPDVKHWDFYKVTVADKRPKYFKGEMAWMDARRYAEDERVRIRLSERRHPLGWG